MWPNPQFPAGLVTFTEEIPNGKLHFLCSAIYNIMVTFAKNTMLWNSFLVVIKYEMHTGRQSFIPCKIFSIICLDPADDVRLPISEPKLLVISLFLHLEQLALKSPVIIEHIERCLLMLPDKLSELPVMILAKGSIKAN